MSKRSRRYWAYRIDKAHQAYFASELEEGRLRQGWGYLQEQALPNPTVDNGAFANRRIYEQVKRGDILLVPEVPEWGHVGLVEATEDFNIGYKFSIDTDKGDYGHTFPAKRIGSFLRNGQMTDGPLRKTLRTPSRFWSTDRYQESIEQLLTASQAERTNATTHVDRYGSIVESVYTEAKKEATKLLGEKLHKQFQAAEWEHALVKALKTLYPGSTVSHAGGKDERHHGADIIIEVPMPLGDEPAVIAIQVKDYKSVVGNHVLDQIGKSVEYFETQASGRLYQQWVFVLKAKKGDNAALEIAAKERNVRVLYEADVLDLFARAVLMGGGGEELEGQD